MRIAVFSYGLPTPGQKRGGIEKVAHDLAQGLARRGHEVVVFSYDHAPAGARYRVRSLPSPRFVQSWLGRRLTMGYLGNLFALVPDIAEFDVVLSHGDSLLLPCKGKPVVRVMHGSALAEALSARTPLRAVAQLGVYVQELLTGLLQPRTVGISRNTRRHNPFVRQVISNGVDLETFHPGAKSDIPTILFVGTLTGRKRGEFLLEIFTREIRPRVPQARLWMVSPRGPSREGVEYFEGIEEQRLAELYRQAWVFASPSTYEGFGLPYVEAMASGTAVVATPNPGSREIVQDGVNGRLVGDEDLAAAVIALLDDAESRHRLEAEGSKQACQFDLQGTVERYEDVLRQAAGAKSDRARSPRGR